jgi:hypothetical protein
MTLSEQTTYAERLARTTPNAVTISNASDVTKKYINEGVREFAKSVRGIPKEEYLEIVPRFDTKTWWAISVATDAVSATDIPITTASRANVTGATVAADLQAKIQAVSDFSEATVTFFDPATTNTNVWKFAITQPGASEITIASPSKISYTDATEVLFSKTGKESSSSWVSNLPQDTFVETDLPSDFLRMTHVEWDNQPLEQGPWELFVSPQTHADPTHYAIKNKKIRLFPVPSQQKMFQIWYLGTETDLAVTGSDDSTNCPLPTQVHMAPVFYAAAKLMEEKHEYQKSVHHMRNFIREVREYRLRESNANWALFPRVETLYRPPKVIQST